jgi:hypothetical protein
MMFVEQAREAMRLQKSNYKLSNGPRQPREQRPLVLSIKPAKTEPQAKTGSPRGAKGKMGGKYSKDVYKKVGKKEILGKERVIYKTKGSNKEYVKNKGMFTSVAEYNRQNLNSTYRKALPKNKNFEDVVKQNMRNMKKMQFFCSNFCAFPLYCLLFHMCPEARQSTNTIHGGII